MVSLYLGDHSPLSLPVNLDGWQEGKVQLNWEVSEWLGLGQIKDVWKGNPSGGGGRWEPLFQLNIPPQRALYKGFSASTFGGCF